MQRPSRMATKAERFRHEAERSKPPRAKKPAQAKKRRDTTDAGARNLTKRAGKKAQVVTEESQSGKRSRKSTRPASHHGKNSTMLEYAERLQSQTSQFRHNQR